MSTITWAIECDFDRDGDYETDITGDIEMPGSGISIDRGMNAQGIYQISKVTIVVANRAGTYSAGNTASARYGQLRPGVPIRCTATHEAIPYVLWSGYIQKFRVTGVAPGTVPMCTFECADIADYLAQFTPVNVLVAERTTSEAYIAVAAAAGLAATDYQFDSGGQSLPVHWVRNLDALTAMKNILDSEMGGSWWVDADGVIRGQSRTSRLGIAVDDTWGDGTSMMPKAAAVETSDADLISSASVQANVFIDDEADQLIFFFSRNAANPTPDSILIEAGATYGPVSLDYAQPIESASVQVAGTDYTANSAIDGTGSDLTSSLSVTMTEEGAGFSLTLKNTGVADLYVTKFEKFGLAQNYVIDRPVFTTSMAIPGDKTDRGVTIQLPFADDSTSARDFSVATLRTWRYEYPRLQLQFDAGSPDATKDSAKKVALLSLELGDLIYYKDTGLTTSGTYSKDWWYVESINIQIPPDFGGRNFIASVVLIPTYLFRNLDAIAFDDFKRDDHVGGLDVSQHGVPWFADSGFDISSNTARPNVTTLQTPMLAVA